VVGKPVDPLEDRLERTLRLTNQQASMHAWLSDRYGAWNLGLTIASLVSSTVLLAFVFASDFVQRTTSVSADAYQWVTGLVAIAFFSVTLVGLVWQPAGKSARHDQAVRHYTKVKYEVGRLLDVASGSLDEDSVKLVETLYLDDWDLPRIPEGKFLKLKRWHKLKVAVSKELDHDLSPVWRIRRRLEEGGETASRDEDESPEGPR
jgi:hypothetical protein